jgi:hypothetical protein
VPIITPPPFPLSSPATAPSESTRR